MSAPITLPPPIGPFLARYVRLRRRHALARAAGLATVCFLAWALGCCLVDRVALLAAATRLILLATGTVAAAVVVFRPLVLWLSRDVNWRAAATDVERRDARFAQRLQTVISELLDGSPRRGGSAEMVGELAREVGEVLTSHRGPAALLRWRPTLLPWLAVLLLVAGAAAVAQLPTVRLPQLARRFLTPLRATPAVTTTRLTLEPRAASVIEGQSLRVTVSAERLTGGGVTLYHAAAGAPASQSVPMTPTGGDAFEAVIGPVLQDERYFARGGDGRTATGKVRVLRRPKLAELRVRYTYPPYADRPPLTVTNTDGMIEAPVGTEAAVTVVASEPLASATLVVGGRTVETTPGGKPHERGAMLIVAKDEPYSLSLTSADSVSGAGPATMMIRATPDRPPLVRVLQPPGELRLSPRDILSLPFQALDDYGVTSLTTNVQITASGVDATGEPINLAQGKPATQPSTWGGAAADRAVDGKTDGNYEAGSVSHTDVTPNAWWQVDLGNVTPVAVIEVWTRTDAQSQRLSDFNVFVSDAPFLSEDPAAIAAQVGVGAYRVPGQAGTPTRVEVFRTARFVRVQLNRPEYLSLAEVRVLQAKPVATGELASRSFDTNLPVRGDPRQQDGEAVLDLARIKVGVGDVVSVSVTANDTGKQSGIGGPIRVVVSPRSIDQRTYDRINELKRAAELSGSLVTQLSAVAAAFDPAAARGVTRIDAYVAALAAATRELSHVSETSAALQSALLRCIIRSDGPPLSVALAAMVDELQLLSSSSSALTARFAFDSARSEADRTALAATLTAARRIAGHVTAILRGEQAGAVLADLDNLRGAEAGTPTAKEAADRARERARRVREDVAAAAKELGLNPGGAGVELRLKEVVGARRGAIAAYGAPDYAPPAQAYAAAMGARETLPALVPRLSAAAQAEAVRPDGNLVRARDLQLAASAALRVREANAATRGEFVTAFAGAVAALQQEHAATGPPLPATGPTTGPTTTSTAPAPTPGAAAAATTPAAAATRAAEARRRMALWARGESEQSAGEAEALARAQELAMQANADLSQRAYESAEAADERIVRELRSAERTFPRAAARYEQAREQVRRSTEKAKQLDRLAIEQQRIAAAAAAPDRAAAAADASRQRLLAEMDKAAEDEGDGMIAHSGGEADTRLAAVTAIRAAQERLAAMPQQLRDVEAATAERAAAAARLAQVRQQAMPPEEQGVATRAVRAAEDQLREAQERVAERLQPLSESVATELVRSLAGYAPETTDAVRGLIDRLRPAMARIQRSASNTAAVSDNVAELRAALDAVQTGLKGAQATLLERDPLTAARAYAGAAASAADSEAAASLHEGASAALARAWDATIHQAAAARLAGLPTMRPLFAPTPDAGAAPPRGAAGDVAAKLPMFFDWGRLPWRPMQHAAGSPRAQVPPGYQDALQAYFEALGVASPLPPPPQEHKP